MERREKLYWINCSKSNSCMITPKKSCFESKSILIKAQETKWCLVAHSFFFFFWQKGTWEISDNLDPYRLALLSCSLISDLILKQADIRSLNVAACLNFLAIVSKIIRMNHYIPLKPLNSCIKLLKNMIWILYFF